MINAILKRLFKRAPAAEVPAGVDPKVAQNWVAHFQGQSNSDTVLQQKAAALASILPPVCHDVACALVRASHQQQEIMSYELEFFYVYLCYVTSFNLLSRDKAISFTEALISNLLRQRSNSTIKNEQDPVAIYWRMYSERHQQFENYPRILTPIAKEKTAFDAFLDTVELIRSDSTESLRAADFVVIIASLTTLAFNTLIAGEKREEIWEHAPVS